MDTINIHQRINNLEIISKLMNSVALQYDCRVKYDAEENKLRFRGDDIYRRTIVEMTIGLFRVK